MEKKNTGKVLIEIEEPCVMALVSLDEREQVLTCIIKKITPEVTDLFASEIERLLKKKYNISPVD